MQKWLVAFAIVVIGSVGALQAGSAPVPFIEGSNLSIALGTLPPVVIPATGTAEVTGPTSLTLAGGTFATTQTLDVTNAFPIVGVQVDGVNDAGNFAAGAGTMGLLGQTKVCLFGTGGCATAAANLTVPLSVVGVGGTTMVMGAGNINITVTGAPWTTGTAQVMVPTSNGTTTPTAMGAVVTGTDASRITWVTPITVRTNIPGSEVIPAFASLRLVFVPEANAPMLLGAGALVLGTVGFLRRRK